MFRSLREGFRILDSFVQRQPKEALDPDLVLMRKFQNASPEEITSWMKGWIENTSHYPFVPIHSSIFGLFSALYKKLDPQTQAKVEGVLQSLLPEVIAAKDQRPLECILLLHVSIHSDFPVPPILEYLSEEKKDDGTILSIINGLIQRSPEAQEKFAEWFWGDPIPIGDKTAFLLFVGLLKIHPERLTEFTVRFMEMNQRLPEDDTFLLNWVITRMIEATSKQKFFECLQELPEDLRQRFLQEIEEKPFLLED